MKKTLLFVTYGGGHVNMVVPLVQKCQAESCYHIEVLGLTSARKILDSSGIKSFGFRDIVQDEDVSALRIGRELLPRFHSRSSGISEAEAIAYLGLSYSDLIQREGKSEAQRLLAKFGRGAFFPIGPLARVLEEKKPDVLITTSAPRAEEAALRVAAIKKIPSVCLLDLLDFTRRRHDTDPKVYANKITVFSDYVRDTLCRRGFLSSQIEVTGNPAFDELSESDLKKKAARFRADSGWQDRKVFLWASQPGLSKQYRRAVVTSLNQLLQKFPDWTVLYRPHPLEDPLSLAELNRIELSRSDVFLPALLWSVDVVLVSTSTVGLQAALCDKPVIQYKETDSRSNAPFVKMGIAEELRSVESLHVVARRQVDLNDPNYLRLKRGRDALPQPGFSCDKIADIIRALCA